MAHAEVEHRRGINAKRLQLRRQAAPVGRDLQCETWESTTAEGSQGNGDAQHPDDGGPAIQTAGPRDVAPRWIGKLIGQRVDPRLLQPSPEGARHGRHGPPPVGAGRAVRIPPHEGAYRGWPPSDQACERRQQMAREPRGEKVHEIVEPGRDLAQPLVLAVIAGAWRRPCSGPVGDRSGSPSNA